MTGAIKIEIEISTLLSISEYLRTNLKRVKEEMA